MTLDTQQNNVLCESSDVYSTQNMWMLRHTRVEPVLAKVPLPLTPCQVSQHGQIKALTPRGLLHLRTRHLTKHLTMEATAERSDTRDDLPKNGTTHAVCLTHASNSANIVLSDRAYNLQLLWLLQLCKSE